MCKDVSEVRTILQRMEAERNKIEDVIVEICWGMRGSISWEQAWDLSFSEIERIQKKLKRNIEVVKETGLPII